MNRTRLGALMIAVGVSSCMWACGDDDDDTGPTAGAAGKGGSGGKGGTGGTGGKGGTGGTAGTTSQPGGGAGGDVNGGGAGGDPGVLPGGGAGGETVGGAGGAGGSDSIGGAGGVGGGPAELTLTEACSEMCDTFFTGHPAPCDAADEAVCNTNCSLYTYDEEVEALFLTYAQCAAADLTSSADYECGTAAESSLTVTPMFPVAAGECEADLCAWACADQTSMSEAVFNRCPC